MHFRVHQARRRPQWATAPPARVLRGRHRVHRNGAHSFARGGKRVLAALTALLLPLGIMAATAGIAAAQAPVGAGFTVTASDLAFILKQIKISENHSATLASLAGNPDPCAGLLGNGPNQVPGPLVSYGLRALDGTCNNLQPGRNKFGAADQFFPRAGARSLQNAEPVPPGFPGAGSPTSYTQKKGLVFDSEPRVVSNLIVDQTSTNPAAVSAAGHPVRTQPGGQGVFVCGAPQAPPPPDCVPEHQTLFIPNVTTDVGLSPPFNGLFTLFGQFFDHGLDFVRKSGGQVFVPLKNDDPLVAGPDHIFGNADDLPPNLRFMVLTRATNGPGPDGRVGDDPATPADESADDVQEGSNGVSPFVDQNQTYSSHPSHQVFLREYVMSTATPQVPVATGALLHQPDGGMGTWGMLKQQAASLLGLQLRDQDITNVPMLAADPYGKFIPGPNGLPQYVTGTGLVEGNRAAPVPVPANALRIDASFLDDIAHHAVPGVNRATGLPQTPDADPGTGDDGDPATYDDEMLNAHFVAGDGRVNENIGLTAVHQIFHSEHDRLVGDIKNTLSADTSPAGVAALAEWKLAAGADGWNGERLFQAAKFVTEMEYQHLVFEEFGRKVQPLIAPFSGYHDNVDPAITAEFAHAVYRFGHSMLTDDIDRFTENPDGSANRFNVSLLNGFLNPPIYGQGPGGAPLTSQQAGGAVLMGMSDQVGNEIDEFVTDTLRNNLLGLPLDLPTVNIARARDTGIPTMNNLRKEIFARTNDGALQPYASWTDFGLGIKHPGSLVNFVAAYGNHPTVVAGQTLAEKRAAAQLIVDPPIGTDPALIPSDRFAFMDSALQPDNPDTPVVENADWRNNGGNSITGVDDIDLWMGGLAEKTNLFGGLLGSTFNYVFERQLTDLQNGDRLYYLARTPGMSLRATLEANSFAEMIMRNTTAHTLKADAFATADCKFELAGLKNNAAGYATDGSTVADDPNSACNEQALLIRSPDGTIRYRTTNSVNPPGINGQAVYNGSADPNPVYGGVDNDTFLGNAGNDRIEGGDGADVALGGDGNDIITDVAGDDVPKGGPGNDAIDAGPGLDIILSGDGKDFTNGGLNINETFGGNGDDFVQAGGGADTVFGDAGNDWIQGGAGADLLQGDSGSPFFDDPNTPGHDVINGQDGDDDYDAEGGDDIMLAGPGIERNAGAGGYDWAAHQYDGLAADADLNLKIIAEPLPVNVLRDRNQETEALSGAGLNDTLRGDDVVPATIGGGGFIGCDVLDQAGLDRIAGLSTLVTSLPRDSAPIIAASAAHSCPITGPVWGEGNILLGGAGTDLLEGRGANDILDGDRYLTVRLSVRTNPADPATEIGTTDLMEHTFQAGNPKTLQQAVFAGEIDAGNIVTVREILVGAAGTDTALFSGPAADYDITRNADNTVVTVAHTRGTALDGTDTLRNVERLQFSDGIVNALPNRPATGGATLLNLGTNPAVPGNPARLTPQENAAVTVNPAAIVDPDGTAGATFTYQWQQRLLPSGTFANVAAHPSAPGRGTAQTFVPLPAGPNFPGEVGRELRVIVSYTDNLGNPETVTSAAAVVGDVYQGTANNDTFTGTAAEDLARAAGGADTLNTGDGNDLVSGDAGDDTMNTGNGDDVVEFTGAGDGFDAIAGAAGTDKIVAKSNGTVIGLRGATALTSVEQVNANGFTGVRIQGSSVADTLSFTTVTLTGIVSIDGGGGDDVMNSSAGNDTFRFSTGMGADRINGFDANPAAGQDLLDVSALGVTAANFGARVTTALSGANTLITVRDGGGVTLGTITVNGVTPGAGVNQISQTDFVTG
jgi:Ca2+-binding RTX toxin-like protein